MAQQERVQKRSSKKSEEVVEENQSEIVKAEKAKEDLDALMDEIDELLIDSADMVRNYVQAGGQ